VIPYLKTERSTLYHARAEEVYPHLEAGSVSMVWSDGRYGMGKSEKGGWDDGGVDTLADWYAPHVEAWGRVCAPSATVYLWNTAEGWARLDPVMRAAGWTFRVLVTWLKTNPPSQKGQEMNTCWADFTEVCGFYQREQLAPLGGPAQYVNFAAGASDRNTIRTWLNEERERAGLRGTALEDAVNEAGGKGNMICRHTFAESQWLLPTFDQWCALHKAWNTRGIPDRRPYLQRDRTKVYDLALRSEYDALRSEYDALRSEYDALRCPFTAPTGHTGNVWTAPMVAPSRRLHTADGETHECEKPLTFADRAIRASTRIGGAILDPFAGTNRIAVACQRLPAEEARHAIGIEMEERWLDAVRPSLIADYTHRSHAKQSNLFTRPP
jgi:site-specific DNA-methyltransferase (adenine-specific)